MRVNVAAAAGAAIAAVLAALSHAPHPAQVVVSIAASCAFLALLTQRGQIARSDWFTVRVLLAGNLVVFGVSFSYAQQLGVVLAVSAVLLRLLLLVIAIRARRAAKARAKAMRSPVTRDCHEAEIGEQAQRGQALRQRRDHLAAPP
jgi:hypothetical protein